MQAITKQDIPAALAAVLATMLAGGCGRGGNEPALHPVRGQVVAATDKPAAGVNIAFHPLVESENNLPIPQATTTSDGAFTLTTYQVGDGAAAGDYAVTAVWPTQTSEGDWSGPDRLRGRYGNPKTTPFRISIKPGENSLEPFRLK